MFKKITVFIFFLFLVNGCTAHRHAPSYTPRCAEPKQKTFSSRPKPAYVIKKGDSLWKISKKFRVPVESLKSLNKITDPSRIKVGQKIYLPVSVSGQKKQGLFFFPVEGKIIHYFGEVIDNRLNKGLKIKSDKNENVFSAKQGKIVFADFLKGYGTTVIIEHDYDFSTVYANLSGIKIKKGDIVKGREILGTVSADPEQEHAILHFELRRGHAAEDPLLYIKHYD